MDVHRVEHPAVPVIQRAATQRHGVHLQKARLTLGPLGPDRNLLAQQRARPRGGPAAVFDPRWNQQPIQRRATGLEQGLAHVAVQAAMILLVGGQPVGQTRLEPHAARLQSGQPNRLKRGAQLVRVVFLGPPNKQRRAKPWPCAERPDGRLAVVPKQFDQFIDDFDFVFLAGPGISLPLLDQHFHPCFLTHFGVHGSVTSLLSQRLASSCQATPPSVTFFLSQIAVRGVGRKCLVITEVTIKLIQV